jgi:Chalcone isomerase-like
LVSRLPLLQLGGQGRTMNAQKNKTVVLFHIPLSLVLKERMSFYTKLLTLTAGLLLATASMANSVDVSGVKFDETIDVAGSKLALNGAGVRFKAVFKVYAAGLYLGKKVTTPADVVATPGNKRITVTMLRDIDATELGKLFSRGIEDNMQKGEFSKLIPSILRMSQIFSDYKTLKTGDVFTIDWIAGTGTVMSIKGKPYGEPFKEPEFFAALTRIWLGPNPADWRLKDALLGKAAS